MRLFQFIARSLRRLPSLLANKSSDLGKLIDRHSHYPMQAERIQVARINSPQIAQIPGTCDCYSHFWENLPWDGCVDELGDFDSVISSEG